MSGRIAKCCACAETVIYSDYFTGFTIKDQFDVDFSLNRLKIRHISISVVFDSIMTLNICHTNDEYSHAPICKLIRPPVSQLWRFCC